MYKISIHLDYTVLTHRAGMSDVFLKAKTCSQVDRIFEWVFG